MVFSINIPVKIVSGRGCISDNRGELVLGSHAAIICGRHSAEASGALTDITVALKAQKIKYDILPISLPNPPLTAAYQAGKKVYELGADFVIGIGGGSAMDTAKAVAAFAAAPTLEPSDIFSAEKRAESAKPLPLVLVPTTAGTGSEANQYSVLTLPDGRHKKTYSSTDSWAKVAFLDPSYTDSMDADGTVSCALDAMAHALESYLSPRSTVLSRMLAAYAGKEIWDVISEYPSVFTEQMRDRLAYASSAAGAAISITGTGFPHPLGYSLTLLDGIPHGKACAVFHGDYIEFNSKTEEGKKLIDEFAAACGTKPALLSEYLPSIASVHLKLTDEEIADHIALISDAKNYTNSPYVLSNEEMTAIYKKHFALK